MKRSRLLLLLFITLLAGSGIALEWLSPADEYALPHPWNGPLRQIHGWACQFALIGLGFMLSDHIQKKWRKKTSHWDGVLNLLLWVGLLLSGLLLYYPPEWLSGDLVHQWHWYNGLAWLLLLVGHWLRYRLSLSRPG